MIATPLDIDSSVGNYLTQFDRLQTQAVGEPAWLAATRKLAIERFTELGFPTTRDEEWKYTNVQPITSTDFQPASATAALPEDVTSLIGSTEIRLVFVDGHFVPELSTTEALPPKVTVTNLAAALTAQPTLVQGHLAQYARFTDQPFVALNTAMMQDGAFIHIARGAVVEEPIYLLYLTTDGNSVSQLRNLYIAEENSQGTVVEVYAGTGVYFNNVVTEIAVAENAIFDHYKAQQESKTAYHIATQQLEQARNSVFSSHNISLGAALCRNDINARLGGEGIECTVNGLYAVNGRQHVDTHTAIDHAMPHCNSHELYKGVMDGRATGVFNGKIFVREDAQKTDAKQTNQNLLLSPDAAINTKPQLEIYADDVRCTHGATIGQLDANALFYLRARGIGQEEARNILIHAFAVDLLDRIQVEPLRERLTEALEEQLKKE